MPDDGAHAGNDALVFVYNADSGLFNTLTDMAHKAFAPQTYSCHLCALTHGQFRMHAQWKAFIAGLGVPCEFLHRDELLRRYGVEDARLPVIYRRRGRRLTLCLDAEAIAACTSMEELQRAVLSECLDT